MRDDSQSRAPRPPPGAFGRRRAGTNPGSNRSSMASFDGMNSEELWRLEDSTPDMSNPTRPSQERPLDTVNRMTNRWDPVPLPEALWPTAPMDMPDYLPPPKTKSLTNVTSIRKRGTLRKSASRASTIDNSLAPIPPKDTLSSAHSSATDLSINMNKSQASLSSRPQSMMLGPYGFDLLSTLAPRDGGYAVAAQLSHNNTFSPTSSGGSDRGSFYGSPPPNPHRQSRGPPAPAMMRYDDDLSPPLTGRLSTTTTSSNLSTYSQDEALDGTAPTMTAAHMSLPTMKSPLSQHTTAAEVASMHPPMTPVEENSRREWPVHRQSAAPASMPMGTALAGAGAAGAAAAAAAAGAVGAAGAAGAAGTADAVGAVGGAALTKSKTKKEIKAEEKAKAKASKLEAKREADRREQEAARQKTAAAKEAAHQREEKAKEAARVKAEDKARAKADKSSRRQSMFGLSSRSTSASAPTASSDPPLAMQPAQQPAQQQRATAPQAASQARPPVSPQATPQVRAPVPPQMPVAPVVPAKDGPVRDGTVMPNGVPNGSAAPVPNGNVPNGSAIGRGPPPAIVVPPRMSSNRFVSAGSAPAAAAAAVGAAGAAGAAVIASQVHHQAPPSPQHPTPAPVPVSAQTQAPPPSSQQLSNGPESRSMPRPNLSPQPSHLNAGPRKNGPTPQQSLPPTPMSSSNSTTPSAASMVASRARTPSAVSMTPSSAQSATSSSLTPTNAATDSGSATSTAPKQKKSGLFTNLRKRFSVIQLDHHPAPPQKQRPVSMAVGGEQNQQRNVSAPPAPPVHRAPVAAAPPVTRPQLNSLPPTPPSKDHSPVVKASKPATRTVPIPPPVIVPPRQSSLARGPEQHSDAEDADHHRQASLSDPSSVVVTPTTSRATNSSPSLFEVRPHAMREDNAWEGGYESAVSDASGKPLRHDMVPAMERPVPSLAAH
ncbi:uncharacterized protein CcaverHIS019_0112580 [Cutaneotrichosporon cavernicola]|uniref:Uncharacterized protein n=1 Tax=Cutaneotrichosporon cavernicola TaxID=279322 RepID=A0AA48I651_9TREE|nr:uncharacterized protein CcaverHIS019_0112580 [Cutaneotrichosporon cavernicola]BEI88540.1 hypothetical protein CcaverHIS019_0112580 [Cutaneotrichosporon cavernicola]